MSDPRAVFTRTEPSLMDRSSVGAEQVPLGRRRGMESDHIGAGEQLVHA